MKILYSIEYFDVIVEKVSWKGTLYKYGVKFDKESEMKFFTTMENAKNHIISQKELEIEKLSKRIETLKQSIKTTKELVVIEKQIVRVEEFFTPKIKEQ